MDSSTITAGTSLVSGIQDISAFLPHLGTDQCEKHVGEAPKGGYLYAAASPLSLFGCLGIVKASATILCASFSLKLAQMFADAGFNLEGSTAAMTGASSEKEKDSNQKDVQYIAGQKLLELIQEQHIN
ncbi:hypothetical protein C8R44DRAFT_552365, partial [Mycena epipterygia]